MRTDFLNLNENSNVHCTQKPEHLNGFYIIKAEPIMTDYQIVIIMKQKYLLVEFKSGGGINYRDVEFWLAHEKQGLLTVILYDIINKVVVEKIFNTKRPNEYSSWFLISPDFFDGGTVEFQ